MAVALAVFAALDTALRRAALRRVGDGALPFGLPLGRDVSLLMVADDEGRDEYRLGKAEADIDKLEVGKADASDVAAMVEVAAEDRKDLRIVIVDVAELRTKIGIYAAIGSAVGTILVTGVVGVAIKLAG